MGKTIAIVCFDDFTDIDVFLPWDVLNRVPPDAVEGGWRVRLVGAERTHTSYAGLAIPMHGALEETAEADAVVVASGSRGVKRAIADEAWLERLALDPERQLVGSMCTGAVVLARLGLLDGLTATTYPTSVPLLESFGVTVVEEPIVVHGNLATAAGCLAAQYLSRWIIERLVGADAAEAALASIRPVGEGCVALGQAGANPPKALGLTGTA